MTMDTPRKPRSPQPKALAMDVNLESTGLSRLVELSSVDSSPGTGPSTVKDVLSVVTSSVPTIPNHSPASGDQAPAVK